MKGVIQTLLPIHAIHVTLRFNEKTHVKTLHSPSLSAFIRYLARSPARFDELIKIDAPESGRCEYLIGDAYHFTLYGLNGSETILQRLILALQKLPHSAVRQDKKMPFRNNLEFECLQDGFTSERVQAFAHLTPYRLADLQRDCEQWQGVDCFRVQLLSPIRLLKEKMQREQAQGEMRFCQQVSDLNGDLLAGRLYDTFAALVQKQGIRTAPKTPMLDLTLQAASHVFWQKADYADADGKAHLVGGMMGEVFIQLAEPAQFDWTLWVLGQFTGFGQRTAFGLGRYVLKPSRF